jgi:valyl-tRNA synthetase
MVMSGLYLVGDVPFRNAVIHGLVRDGQGRKMSKSLGNVIDPIDMIDRYGADALRFSLARAATGSQQDIPLSEEAIEGGRHFANKLWNAARLVFGSYPGGAPELPPEERWTLPERWLLSRHQACLAEVDRALDDYRFADATQALYRFVWSEYCDWGLELEKGRLEEQGSNERADAANVLAWVLERTLRLLHPIMPFVTEEIWQRFGVDETICLAAWPEPVTDRMDAVAERSFGLVRDVVTEIRRFRARHGLPPSRRIEAVARVPDEDRATVEGLIERIVRLAGLSELTVAGLDGGGKPQGWTRLALADRGVVLLPPGLFDVGAERARLRKERGETEETLRRSRGKLANEGFRSKAAPGIVITEQEKVDRAELRLAELDARLHELDDEGNVGA